LQLPLLPGAAGEKQKGLEPIFTGVLQALIKDYDIIFPLSSKVFGV